MFPHIKKLLIIIPLFFSANLGAATSLTTSKDSIITEFLWTKFLNLSLGIRPKIGIALGGGGARGLAHIGVLRALEEEKIPVDMLSGTLVGAIVGGLYASGVDLAELEHMAEDLEWNKLFDLSAISLMGLLVNENFLSSEKMEKYLASKIPENDFAKTKRPFACVGCDIQTGERIVFRDGDLILGMRASSSIPGLLAPVEYRHRFIVDGGIVDNMPSDITKILGADFVIAVNVQGDFTLREVKKVMNILNQVISIQGGLLNQNSSKYSDFIISPNVGEVDRMDLRSGRECIMKGYLETKNTAQEIKRAIITKYFEMIVTN